MRFFGNIKEEELDIIFHLFHRLENTSNTKQKGYGLGLAIAKEIIDLHQGSISAKNRISGGLNITIRLPLIRN